MASGLYVNYKQKLLGSDTAAHALADWDTNTIKCGILSSSDYTVNLSTHQDWADTVPGTLNTCYNSETCQTLSNITITAGVIDNTADITFSAVAIDGTKDVDILVHYLSSGTVTTDPLLTYHDLSGAAVTPNGGDIVVQYHASGIFAL